MSLSFYFFSPVQLRRGSDRAALVGTWHLARVNPLHVGITSVLALLPSHSEELGKPPSHFLSSPVSWPDLYMGQAGEYIKLVLSSKYHPVATIQKIPTLQRMGDIQVSALCPNSTQMQKCDGESFRRLGRFLSCRLFAVFIERGLYCSLAGTLPFPHHGPHVCLTCKVSLETNTGS